MMPCGKVEGGFDRFAGLAHPSYKSDGVAGLAEVLLSVKCKLNADLICASFHSIAFSPATCVPPCNHRRKARANFG
ncbi:hypothetical protein BQ8794_600003 [Mesorhizobium prunaredense]|uniref:Uncharacterized protein n=1 Tax=Mesorhizobium prunaredense TaxID=1631249 RepID=A0A1R3VJJ5_9HYPH|nr:hypothetical protein BQ8794_600003 [Mesorhizobium prunaredense]